MTQLRETLPDNPTEIIITDSETTHVIYTAPMRHSKARRVMSEQFKQDHGATDVDYLPGILVNSNGTPYLRVGAWIAVWDNKERAKLPEYPLTFKSRFTGEVIDAREMVGLDN
jgi:hypothetical protein